MDKYDGIYKAEAFSERVVYVKRRRARSGGVVRLLVAAVLVGVCFGLKYIPQPFAEKAVEKVREAVCYDVLGQETGTTVVDKLLETDEERKP